MNIFVREIGVGNLKSTPDHSQSKLVVEDNIGESIHIHVRNTRLEFSIHDYLMFAECVEDATQKLNNGDN